MVLLVWVGLAGGCTSPAPPPAAAVPTGNASIIVVASGWHSDIALPTDELGTPLADLERDFPDAHFLVFGFGERAYLMARDGGSGEMLGALLPSESAIRMTALRAPPAEVFGAENLVTLHLSRQAVDRIAALIWQGMEKQADGTPRRLAGEPYAGSVLYAATETYDALHTCNSWTAQLLHEAGLPVDPNGVLFTGQVMDQARQIAALQAGTNH